MKQFINSVLYLFYIKTNCECAYRRGGWHPGKYVRTVYREGDCQKLANLCVLTLWMAHIYTYNLLYNENFQSHTNYVDLAEVNIEHAKVTSYVLDTQFEIS